MKADTTTIRLWTHMLAEGGRWNASELAEVVQWSRARANKLVSAMAAKGICRAYRASERKNGRAYGVDGSCKLPRGMTLAQVMTLVTDATPRAHARISEDAHG